MPNIKITELTAETAPISTDLVMIVDDPGGTPISKKATIGNLGKGLTTVGDMTVTGGTNTFNLTNGTASLDVAAGAAVNIDDDVTATVAINASANGLLAIGTDGMLSCSTTPGKVRISSLIIQDGTTADTIKVTLTNRYNGDAQAIADNIGKSGSSGVIALSADGSIITISTSGDALGCISSDISYNSSALDPIVTSVVTGANVVTSFSIKNNGAVLDLTTIASGKEIDVTVCYITNA